MTRRTFEKDGFERDPVYVTSILEHWLTLHDYDALAVNAAKLRVAEMHDEDRVFLQRMFGVFRNHLESRP